MHVHRTPRPRTPHLAPATNAPAADGRHARRRAARLIPSRRAVAAVGAGTLAFSVLAIPAFALRSDDTTDLQALATDVTAVRDAVSPVDPSSGSRRDDSAAEAWQRDAAAWSDEQELAFRLLTASDEERAAWSQFVAPPTTTPVTTRSTTPATVTVRTDTTKVAAAAVPPATPATTVASSGSGAGGYLGCVRDRESRGQYGVVNGSSGAGGAYQFLPQTWNNTAQYAGRPDLVGVHPSQASPVDQDAMAQALYQWQGAAPWAGPGC